jgi:hypothetical protein
MVRFIRSTGLASLKFEQPVYYIVLEDCIAAVEAATARRDRLEAHIEATPRTGPSRFRRKFPERLSHAARKRLPTPPANRIAPRDAIRIMCMISIPAMVIAADPSARSAWTAAFI